MLAACRQRRGHGPAVAYLTKPFDPRARAAFVAHELVAARPGSSDLRATVAI